MITLAIIVYLLGAVATAVLCLAILSYRGVHLARPSRIMRNALLWPICLPIIYRMWRSEGGRW